MPHEGHSFLRKRQNTAFEGSLVPAPGLLKQPSGSDNQSTYCIFEPAQWYWIGNHPGEEKLDGSRSTVIGGLLWG